MIVYFKDEPNHYYTLLVTEVSYLVLLALLLFVTTIINNIRVKPAITGAGFAIYSILMIMTSMAIVYYDYYGEMDLLSHCLIVVLPAFGLVIAGNRLDRLRYLARVKNQEPFTRCKIAQPFLRNPYTDMSMIQVVTALLTWIF